jgi:hypothetical protein
MKTPTTAHPPSSSASNLTPTNPQPSAETQKVSALFYSLFPIPYSLFPTPYSLPLVHPCIVLLHLC